MKKQIVKIIYKPALLFLVMLMPALAMAQGGTEFDEGDGDGDDVDDEVTVPINGYVAASLLAGCTIGYVLLRRDTKVS